MCFNGIGNMYKVHAFHHREHVLLGLWDKKQNKMKQQKNNYIVPTVKSVSFVVEVGSQLSETNIGKYSEDPTLMQPGSHQLREQSWTGSVI